MDFRIGATPASEEFGGLPDEDPANFIYLNLPGCSGAFAYDGEALFVLVEGETIPRAADSEMAALLQQVERGSTDRDHPLLQDPRAEYGQIYFQERAPNVMHVEYCVEVVDGEGVDADQHPVYDRTIETALRRWLAENEAEVVRVVQERAGEMR
jgi:hypothetical protein